MFQFTHFIASLLTHGIHSSMGAALNIDKEAVKMLVIQYGVREAARQLGLPEPTVAAWSARGKWLADLPRSTPLPASMVQSPAISAINPSTALVSAMKEDSLQTRASLLRVTRRALAQAERCDDQELMVPEVANVIHTHAKSAALGGAWSASQAAVKLDISVTSGTARIPTEAVEAEWVEIPDSE